MSMRLVLRSLRYYWRTNTAVVAGVAAAVTVLAGALLVGDSVRGSLRDLVLQRLGRTDLVVLSADFFRAELADHLRTDPAFAASFVDTAPVVYVQGLTTEQLTGRRASRVQVYGIDERFWRFHGVDNPPGPAPREILLSSALADAIGAAVGSAVLLRVQQPSAMPLESMHGRKDDVGRTLRLTVGAVLAPADLGEFSLQPQQGDVLAAFVPLARLQEDLDLGDRVNALLVSARPGVAADPASLEALIRQHATLEDVGLTLRTLESQHAISLETDRGLIDDARAEAARAAAAPLRLQARPVLTYLVNTIRLGDRAIPYSLVSAIDLDLVAPELRVEDDVPPIVLNDWAARDLGAGVGDRLTLEYFVWQDPGRLVTETSEVVVARIVPLAGPAADRDLAPHYPGITGSENLQDWDPPFPIDLSRIRPIDERYWDEHRATPKGFIPLAVGDALWRSRYGALTAIRLMPASGMSLADAHEQYAARLRAILDPLVLGMAVRAPRAEGLAASRGATNFGEYFTYFSFFLVASAVTLSALFFKLGIEQRVREIGLLRAVGFNARAVRHLFATEAVILSLMGSGLGILGALGYGWLMMTGLRTLWIDAVGTRALSLHVSWLSLLAGAAGGVASALVCIWWTLGALGQVSERSLLSGQLRSDVSEDVRGSSRQAASRWRFLRWPGATTGAIGFLLLGLALMLLGFAGRIDEAGAFFGAGASLLVASLSAVSAWLRRRPRTPIAGRGWWPVSRLGLRNAAYRPARSVLSVGVMASATFILISVDAFRREGHVDAGDPHAGTGGYALMVETLLPVAHDPGSEEGRGLLGLSSRADVGITPFRVLPGDDASCLNLYEPRQPRIIAPGPGFIAERRFTFRDSLDGSDEERENPWRLLLREYPDGAVPVIADANSMTYVLHRTLGDEIVIDRGGMTPLRLRLVAALSDSVLQGELVMSETNFLKLFPEQEGYQLLLVEAPPDRADEVAATLEDRLADFGADAVSTADRIDQFHRVENTYLSTFQTLGGLGLLLGTIGLAAVLLRNVLERRRELALLGAVGFGRDRLFLLVIAESALLLSCGLAAGTLCALIAVAPAAMDRGGALPAGAGIWLLLFGVFATGLVSAVVATRAAIQSPLLDALKAE
jgi:ABC-type antimicrobial peptide transport system permease subunit